MSDELLPREIVFDVSGHLSEVALTTIADGQQAIVPGEALAHLASCDACTREVGHAAMLSARVAEVMATAVPVAAPVRAAIPWVAIGAALLLAALGALPAIVDYPVWLAEASSFFTRTVPLVVRSGIALLRTGGAQFGPAVSFACASLLLMAGFAVSRAMPRRSAS